LSEVMAVVRGDVNEGVGEGVMRERRELDGWRDRARGVSFREVCDFVETGDETSADVGPCTGSDGGPAFGGGCGGRDCISLAARVEPFLPERHVGYEFGDRVRGSGDAAVGVGGAEAVESLIGREIGDGGEQELVEVHGRRL